MLELLEPPIDGDLATFDLVDGFRVERNMSNVANVMSFRIGALLEALLGGHNAGFVATEAIFRLKPGGKPRRPDVAYVAADRFDLRTATEKDPWDAVPNLAVEVISPSNTVAEIEEKLEEYFAAGVLLALVVSARARRVSAYRSTKDVTIYEGNDSVDLSPALPGAALRLDDLYSRFGK